MRSRGACLRSPIRLHDASVKRFLITVAVLAAGALAEARAEVFIYYGTLRAKTDYDAVKPGLPSVKEYVIIDYDAGKLVEVTFFQNKVARKYNPVSVTTPGMMVAQSSRSTTDTLITNAFAGGTAPDDFGAIAFLLRGKNVSLVTRQSPLQKKAERPKTLTGTAFSVLATPDGQRRFAQKTVAVAFQAKATISANEANKTIETVANDIVEALKGAGFVQDEPVPGR